MEVSNGPIKPSDEQQIIIDSAIKGNNIICDSVPGSGKSSTILYIAESIPNKNILQLTFNSSLKFEIRKKAALKNLKNIDVHTYHSLNLLFYCGGYDDFTILDTVRTNKSLNIIPKFDLIIIDEAQDMTDLYYTLIRKFVVDSKSSYQLIVMGDTRQCVYNFKGANSEYLNKADVFWPQFQFIRLSLSTSFRLTPDIANFINKCMIGQDLIKTIKPSHGKVNYIVESRHSRMNKNIDPTYILVKEIKEYINSGKYTESDIFIICPSVKDKNIRDESSPINMLANELSEAGINIYKTNDDEKFDERFAVNKLLISTLHSSKGIEKPLVILYGFTSEYFKFYGKGYDPMICPSTLYVGASRASEKLIIYQNGEIPPFICGNVHDVADVKGDIFQKNKQTLLEVKPTAITKLIKFLPSELLYDLNDLINYIMIKIQEPNNVIELKSEIEIIDPTTNKTRVEQVSDLNGLAIVTRYQNETVEDNFGYYFNGTGFVYRTKEEIESRRPSSFDYYLKQANILWAHSEKLIYRMNQIKEYKWLDDVNWPQLKQNFKLISDNTTSEVMYEHPILNKNMVFGYKKDNGKVMYIDGIMDAFTNNIIFEFKCTIELTIEHKLQLIFYSWMMHFLHKRDFTCILLNLRTGEAYKLLNDNKLINEICTRIINHKTNNDYNDNENREVGPFIKMMDIEREVHLAEY